MPWSIVTALCLSSANQRWVRVHEPYSDWLIPLWHVLIQQQYTPGCPRNFQRVLWLESAWKNQKQTTAAMGSSSVLLCSSTWYIPGLHLIFISLATVDITLYCRNTRILGCNIRLLDNAAFVCVHVVGRFSKDFSEVRGLRSRGFQIQIELMTTALCADL